MMFKAYSQNEPKDTTGSVNQSERISFSLFSEKFLHMAHGRERDELDLVYQCRIGRDYGRISFVAVAILRINSARQYIKYRSISEDKYY